MFFSEELLTSKKGSFGIIWLAATLGPRTKKITRKQLIGVDLSKTCELIAEPPEPLALRLSGCLLVGVARVYNQNYENFYADVSTFHDNLRKTILHDPNTISGGPGATFSLDLPGDGKSRNDVITFSDKLDLDLPWSLDFSSMHFNWKDPFGSSRKRRSSSQLESIPSQQARDEDDEEGSDEDDDDDVEVGRKDKRRRIASSPGIFDSRLKIKSKLGMDTSRTEAGQRSSPFDIGPIEPVELDIWQEGDISFSEPSRPDFQFPQEDAPPIDTFEIPMDIQEEANIGGVPQTPINRADGSLVASALKKRKETTERSDVEGEDEAIGAKKKTRTKRAKQVSFDDEGLELPEAVFHDLRDGYADRMDGETRLAKQRESDKKSEEQAKAMVDGGGCWMDFLDPDMNAVFATFSKAGPFKWEKKSKDEKQSNRESLEAPERHDDQGLGSGNHLGNEDPFTVQDQGDHFPSYVEDMIDYTIPVNETSGARRDSELDDVEQVRRASHISSQALPWDTRRVDSSPGNPGYIDLADDSFSPGTLRLSVMTPQERRIRLSSRNTSSHGNTGSQARPRVARSRSGSILAQRMGGDPQMLVDDDLELPLVEDFEITESQAAAKIADLPEAFQPGMLATLEDQCRTFLTYVEKTMVRQKTDEILFDELLPRISTPGKRVAALAFYNCLTIATKHMIVVNQPQPWQGISIRFATSS